MAALCPGVQYGLSSQGNFGENKDFIFVRLTDSALRAIEEYIRNKNKFSQNPSIQFLGKNEGQVSIPLDHERERERDRAVFSFQMSSTQDMEGPGGSFECVRQQGSPGGGASRSPLESLGPIQHKLRILAKDDVYEATKHRMTVAEENHKNKRTRVIKPNQTDIGRKVMVKQPIGGRSMNPQSKKELSNSSTLPLRESSLTKPSNYLSSNNSINSNSKLPPISVSSVHHHSQQQQSNGHLSNGYNNRPPSLHTKSAPDMMKRPIKERLIHLLALRPHKKPELLEKINRDNKEKNVWTTILKQIAFMQGNTYHLHQHMWNDVNEEWPFYTEQEKQLLKRRKPQNLTPPGSSDTGSSGSGQSPTSTHPGSPPPPIQAVPLKRPGYTEGADGLPTKRARISHYRKPEPSRLPVDNNSSPRRLPTDSRDSSNMNPRSREPPSLSFNGYKFNNSDDEMDGGAPASGSLNSRRKCDSQNSINYNVCTQKTLNSICSSPNKVTMDDLFRGKESPLEGHSPLERQYSLENNNRNLNLSPQSENSVRHSPLQRSPLFRRASPMQQSPYEKNRSSSSNSNSRNSEKDHRWQKLLSSNTTHNGQNYNSPESHNEDRISPLSQSRDRSSPINQSRDRSSPINQSKDRDRDRERDRDRDRDRDRASPIISQSRDRTSPINQSKDRTSPVSQSRDRTSPVNQSRDRTSPLNQSRDRKSPISRELSTSSVSIVNESRSSNLVKESSKNKNKSEFPDYLTEYTTIKNLEQRRRYKGEFNADYAEYRKLHSEVEKVSRRFAQLEERLRQEDESSQAYKEIRRQIVRDYKENQRDPDYQKNKRRFQYLHDKLSHIKRLVLEYDQGMNSNTNSNSNSNSTTQNQNLSRKFN